jgi:hypothetical protein
LTVFKADFNCGLFSRFGTVICRDSNTARSEAAIAGAASQQGLSGAERQDLQRERKRNRELEKELKRKNAALAEAAALLVLQKSPGHLGGRRGRLIAPPDRQMAITLIEEAVRAGARGRAIKPLRKCR